MFNTLLETIFNFYLIASDMGKNIQELQQTAAN